MRIAAFVENSTASCHAGMRETDTVRQTTLQNSTLRSRTRTYNRLIETKYMVWWNSDSAVDRHLNSVPVEDSQEATSYAFICINLHNTAVKLVWLKPTPGPTCRDQSRCRFRCAFPPP